MSFLASQIGSEAYAKHPADGKYDYSYVAAEHDERFEGGKPTLDYARGMPQDCKMMRHEQILQLCVEGYNAARREALIRHVMAVDEVGYDEAEETVNEIENENRKFMHLEYMPYHAGILTAIGAGFLGWPLAYDLDWAIWFNENFVTTDIPEPKDLETMIEGKRYYDSIELCKMEQTISSNMTTISNAISLIFPSST